MYTTEIETLDFPMSFVYLKVQIITNKRKREWEGDAYTYLVMEVVSWGRE